MLAKRVSTFALQIGSSLPKSNISTTLCNNYRRDSIYNTYRRWYKEKLKEMKRISSPINFYIKYWKLRSSKYIDMFSRSLTDYCATSEKTAASDNEEQTQTAEKKENGAIQTLQNENLKLKENYQRVLADRENIRMRLQKEITDAKVFGIQSFCKDLLEVSDVFRKALENVPKESLENADKEIKNLYDGITMTETQLHNVFGRHGLKQFLPKVGEKFDPSSQEAMMKIPAKTEEKSGTVAIVFRSGWKLRERYIRSAQVSVFKGS